MTRTSVIFQTKTVKVKPVTPKEIKTNLNPKKAPAFELITREILKQMPRKGINDDAYLINVAFRLKHVRNIWKVSESIVVPKPGKSPNSVNSYRPVSLLLSFQKSLKRFYWKELNSL